MDHNRSIADKLNVEARLEKTQSRQFTPDGRIVMPRNHLERRLDAVVAIPRNELFDLGLMPGAQTDDRREGGQTRHQSYGRFIHPSIADADRVAWKALQDFHARDGVGHVDSQRSLHAIQRRDNFTVGPHGKPENLAARFDPRAIIPHRHRLGKESPYDGATFAIIRFASLRTRWPGRRRASRLRECPQSSFPPCDPAKSRHLPNSPSRS